MDVPRLTTLQALLIILKARESAPKRGYYYRSWMSIVQCVQIGKDLGLDEHYEDHQAGQSCGLSPAECLLRTRIWQTIFVCEVMIGSPQGKSTTEMILHLHTDSEQAALIYRSKWTRSTSLYRGRYRTVTSRSTTCRGILPILRAWSATFPE